MKNIITQIIVLLAFTCQLAYSQTDSLSIDELVDIKLENGSKIVGKVVNIDSKSIFVSNNFGITKIAKTAISEYSHVNNINEKKDFEFNDFSDSYYLMPSARPVGKGNSYYKNYLVFYNQFNLGLSDRLSLSAGFESYSLFLGDAPRIFHIGPKYSFGSGKNHIGIGTSLFLAIDDGDSAIGGIVYANYTYGTESMNITGGLGFLYADDSDNNPVVFNLSGLIPIGKKVSLMMEIIAGDFDGQIFSLGVRIKSRNGISIDAGVFRSSEMEDDLIGLPLFGLSVPLKKSK